MCLCTWDLHITGKKKGAVSSCNGGLNDSSWHCFGHKLNLNYLNDFYHQVIVQGLVQSLTYAARCRLSRRLHLPNLAQLSWWVWVHPFPFPAVVRQLACGGRVCSAIYISSICFARYEYYISSIMPKSIYQSMTLNIFLFYLWSTL